MLFNSFIFLVFAALFFALWPLVRPHARARWIYLTATSFFFYGWWDWRFVFLLLGSGLIDYVAGLAIYKQPKFRRWFLCLSLMGNLGALTAFKYSGFLADNLQALLASFGCAVDLRAELPDIVQILPVGISFYTFQAMSYTIDVYRGRLVPTANVFHYFAYLSLFPQLVAGPIIRAADLLPQLRSFHLPSEPERWEGLKLIVNGYFKKVVIADNLAPVIEAAFSAPTLSVSSVYWWFIITAFALQIYCDFSGYSDIARGLARWMGYDFMVNFNHPYLATSLREFWTRWHISLSTWFRDYVYVPLGGSEQGALRAHVNMWTTMLLSGFWHGAAWTFVVWGALHALFLSVERVTAWPERLKGWRVTRALAVLVVIIQVWVAWVFFRAHSLDQALRIVQTMFDLSQPWDLDIALTPMFFLSLGLAMEIGVYFRWHDRVSLGRWTDGSRIVLLVLMAVACVYLRGPGTAFIYFQF